jgi:serine/threonine protein kinase
MDGGSLADLLATYGKLPEVVLANVATQALKGLAYLQKNIHIVHRGILNCVAKHYIIYRQFTTQ